MTANGLKVVELPVIDVTQTNEDTAKRLIDAVATHGFVYLKNNHEEIPPTDIDEMFCLVGHLYLLSSSLPSVSPLLV